VSHPLIAKLEQHGPLSDEEKQVIQQITSRVTTYKAHEEVVPEGSTPSHSSLVLKGFAARHQHLADRKRQITAFHVPGDFMDLHSFLLKKMEDGVGALTPCTVAAVPHSDLREITKNYPYLTRVLWLTTLVDAAVHRTWIMTLGRMDARNRVAHFLCEMHDRLEAVGLTKDHGYDLRITQQELSDAFGLTGVHVNRILQELRGDGLITSRGKSVVINDWERLQKEGQYNPDYLHLSQQIERD
jgi:CRP-like cAMP-binding protein